MTSNECFIALELTVTFDEINVTVSEKEYI
jgi:hypothetical protein